MARLPVTRHAMSCIEPEKTLQNRRAGTGLAEDEKRRLDALRENLGMEVPVPCQLESLADELLHLFARAWKIFIGDRAGCVECIDIGVEPARYIVGNVWL